ncbi:glycosyl hydrolase 53 [Acaromyces ingoldii]|uniref:Arabinogalactan endo-beta-1,4-galactanase n=1 Tax=Acaromyces ingoldii TaxID=215250 RepID=A0A316YGA8_9BASI|nr:glycosyl hydrolase 53 [Acaromyces ingoldii]PWN87628.1 glycosyl hydrolase 53 [Acaromyces ingoldii]
MHFFVLLPLLFATALAALPYKGVDWSSLLVEEKAGKTYKDTAGQVQPLESILKASGVNTVRQRIWVNPSDGVYNLDYNLKLAKRAKAAGLGIYLDFHYSDTWADGGHQVTPAAWKDFTLQQLTDEIYSYTKDVLDTFATNGIPLALVSIGNEIRGGMLWPTGQISKAGGTKNLSSLLHSASTAVKDSKLSPKPEIMIHLDNGWDFSTQENWYDSVFGSNGGFGLANFDIQGISYYPFYGSSATLAAVSSSMSKMAQKYGKTVMVAETDWPTYCPSPAYPFPSDTKSIPISVDGQTQWMKTVASKVSGIGSQGQGIFYWEPAWIDNANLGSSCAYNLMVTDQGQAMASLGVFKSI